MKRILLALMLMPFMALATTYYVNGTTGSDTNPGTSPESAKATIQAAIDVSTDGDTILVAPGTYAPIDASTKNVTVRSTSGASVTVIDGEGKQRCATLGSMDAGRFSTIIGFTLTRGYAGAGMVGGSAALQGFVADCVITKGKSDVVVYGCGMRNCLVYDNELVNGYAVAMNGEALNCTMVAKDGDRVGWDNTFTNCVLVGSIFASRVAKYCCCYCRTDEHRDEDPGNINTDPRFADAANGDYRLAAGSPCIDKGNNDYVVGDMDLDGNARIKNGIVDIGCYEYCQTFYVDGTTGSDTNPGTSPGSAKKTIQAAIDVSTDGDEILVAPGTYAPIVSHAKKISIVGCGNVRDVVIDGGGASVCAILCDVNEGNTNTILRGFTLRNGYSHDDYGAAGVTYPGAATYRGKVENCMITKCTGPTIVVGSAAYNCLIYSNKVTSTGVLMHNTAYNCTVVDNDSAYTTWDNGLYNVLCWNSGGWYTSPGEPENHYNCYKSIESPKFADLANGDYRLAAGSPCIDAGNNDYVVGDKDLEGCGRIVNGTVDIGCYEFEPDGGPYVETVGDVDWTYMIKNGRASVGDGTATAAENLAGAVSVPTWLRQRPVNAIDDKAFVDCDAMTALTVPAGIKTMGDSVFEGCSGLKDLYIESDTLSSVGADAFKGCYWDLIVHVPATWQGRGRTLGGYSVWRAGSSDEDKSVSVTVTNVVVQYVLNSVQSEIAVPICGETGFVTVITEITSSGAVSIPVEWKDNYPLFEAKFGTDFANALRSKSGKRDYANKELLVWQDFVAGTDPTDEDDVFSASITMVGDKPMISYTPELSAEETAKRVYTISGKKSLTDGSDWEVVEPGKEADYNFFKVSVRMK